MPKSVVGFEEIDKNDVHLVGEKGTCLGEMTQAGFPIPNGFVITPYAYHNFVKQNKLDIKIQHLLSTVSFSNEKSLNQVSHHIKKYLREGKLSQDLIKEVISAYNKLKKGALSEYPQVSIGSSVVKGDAVLLEKIKESWALLFESKAILYRYQQKLDEQKTGMALIVQKSVDPKVSGVMFTIDPATNDKSRIIVQIKQDIYAVKKSDFSILDKKNGKTQRIPDQQIIELAKLGEKVEKHYYFPQEVKWVIENNQFFITQIKPVTTISNTKVQKFNDTNVKLPESDIILKGDPLGTGIASGPVKLLFTVGEYDQVMPGDIVVVQEIIPNFMTALKKAAAIISDSYDRSSYTSIVAKKLGIPIIVGTQTATETLRNGNIVTVNGTKGEVYKGGFAVKQLGLVEKFSNAKTATKLYVNLAKPELAEESARKNVDGVGLLQAEYVIEAIGIHPKKMLRDGKKQEFIDQLANEIAVVCKAFGERPVVYRASDFKTNEYLQFFGGNEFELQELNPILGFRGAFRHAHQPEVFELELEAIKTVRDKMGYRNLWLMISFVRTVEELISVKKIINKAGLEQSPNFKLCITVETPANVIMLEKFIEVGIDGVSIDADDLTMLIMGADRNNIEIANEFNEMHPAVLWAFERIIKTANKYQIMSSVYGQTISAYPELIRNLVSWGITSVSVLPDAVDNTRKLLAQTEKELLNQR